MTCFHSRPAWKSTLPNENGQHPLNFTWRTDRKPDYFIDCGRCEGCRASQRRDWAVRIAHESQLYDRNSFVTLTYDDEHCPEFLDKHAVQVFLKRLRRATPRPFRYFICGEYGEKTKRPHYHAIIFNEDFRGGRFTYTINDELWGNKRLDRIWQNGTCAIADFTFSTAMYTAGYTAKKLGHKDIFTIQSRNPPIGKEWLRRNHDNIRRNGFVVMEGKEMPVPQVYWNWLKGEETFDKIKEELCEKINVLNDKKLRNKKYNFLAKQNLRGEKL